MKVDEFRLKLYPKDYQRQKQFYDQVLGFAIVHEWDRPESKGVMFKVGESILEFMWPIEHGLEDISTGSGLSLGVDDANALYASLKNRVTIGHELRHNAWGDTSFSIIDPEGYAISFFTKDK